MPFKVVDKEKQTDEPDRESQTTARGKPRTPPPDWAPRRGPAPPIIRLDPDSQTHTMRLGAHLHQRYSVDAGNDVAWTHTLDDRLISTRSGQLSSVDVHATDAGERSLKAMVAVDGVRHRAPDIKLVSPRGNIEIIGLFGRATRGTFPIANSIQLGEDLVVHVYLPYTDDAIDKVSARFSGAMRVKQTSRIGLQKFEVVLTPLASVEKAVESKDGGGRVPVRGDLSVMPARVNENAIRPTELAIEVLPRMKHAGDFGGRPMDTKDAIGRVSRRWASLYERRITGLHALLSQIAEKDPVPPPPLFEQILKAAASIALTAATAGIGQACVAGFKAATIALQGTQEAIKSMLENSMSSIVQGIASGMSAAQSGPATLRTEGGTLLQVRSYFLLTQEHALNASKTPHVDRVTTSISYLAELLDRDQPGLGYRAAVAAAEAAETELKFAEDIQYAESLQAWCRLQAQLALGVGNRAHGRDKGTELATHMNIEKVMRPRRRGELGLEKTPGVLRLELGTPSKSQKGLYVKRALVEGFDNDTIVAGLNKPVRELRVPMVAVYRPPAGERDRRHGFIVSRNENGACLADSEGGVLQDMFDGMSDHEAARYIFEHQIAHQVLSVARG